MNILIAHNFYRSHMIGGEDIVVLEEVQALKAALGEQHVHTLYAHNDQIRFLPLLKNIFYDRHHAANVRRIIQEYRIDILHIHNFFPLLTPSVILTAKSLGVKVIQTLHNFRPWCLSGILYRDSRYCDDCVGKKTHAHAVWHRCYRQSAVQSGLAASAFAFYRKQQYEKHIDAYFVLSKTQKDQLLSFGVSSQKLMLKPNFVNVPAQFQTTERKGIIYVGRLEESKGFKLLCQAWSKLINPPLLTVIGEGPLMGWAKEYTQGLPITFLGKQPQERVLAAYKQSQFLVHPGLAIETFGLTVLEAMAMGTPVIGLNVGTRREWIRHQQNGFLCSPERLADCVQEAVVCSNYDTLSKNAYAFAKSFSRASIVKQQINYYEQVTHQ